MARGRSISLDALCFGHGESGVEEVLVVEVVQRKDTCLAVVELAHVARVVHACAVLDAGNRHLLDFLHGEIEEGPVVTIVSVAIEVDGVGLVVGT